MVSLTTKPIVLRISKTCPWNATKLRKKLRKIFNEMWDELPEKRQEKLSDKYNEDIQFLMDILKINEVED